MLYLIASNVHACNKNFVRVHVIVDDIVVKIGTYIIFPTLYSLIPCSHFCSHMIVLMTHQFHYQLFCSLHPLQSTLPYYLLFYHFTLLSFAVIDFTPSYILALPYTHCFFKLPFSHTVVLHSHCRDKGRDVSGTSTGTSTITSTGELKELKLTAQG